FSVGNGEIGPEREIGARLEPLIFAEMQWPGGSMRPFGHDEGARSRLDPCRRRGMVAMRVGDEHVRHRLAAHGIEQFRYVLLVFGTECRQCARRGVLRAPSQTASHRNRARRSPGSTRGRKAAQRAAFTRITKQRALQMPSSPRTNPASRPALLLAVTFCACGA